MYRSMLASVTIVCTIKRFNIKREGGEKGTHGAELGNFMPMPVRARHHERAWGDFVWKKHPAV